MKKTFIAINAAALFILASWAWAADISGKWTIKSGQYVITLNFKVEGSQLTGTVENAQAGGSTAIKDGKVEGDNISFYVVRTSNEVDTTITWKGKVEGSVIIFTRETEGGSGAFSGGEAGRGGGDEVVARRAK
jgi:hypothetical protein